MGQSREGCGLRYLWRVNTEKGTYLVADDSAMSASSRVPGRVISVQVVGMEHDDSVFFATEEPQTVLKNKPVDEFVIKMVAAQFGVRKVDMIGSKKDRHLVRARWVAMLLMREAFEFSLANIGKRLSVHHTTVVHGVRAIRKLARTELEIQRILDAAWRELQHYGYTQRDKPEWTEGS